MKLLTSGEQSKGETIAVAMERIEQVFFILK